MGGHFLMKSRVLHIGFGPTALSALEALIPRFDVVGLVREDDSSGNRRDEVIRLAKAAGIRICNDGTLSTVSSFISEVKPDCVVISSYNRILPPKLLAQSLFINVHYADLPRYRGRANVNWALINGEKETAISIHLVEPGLDAGGILFKKSTPIDDNDTIADIYDRLNNIQRQSIVGAVEMAIRGDKGEPQDETKATYGCSRNPDDGEINWFKDTHTIDRLIRALRPPFPGAFTYFKGRRLFIYSASPSSDTRKFTGRIPGRVVLLSKNEGFVEVLTGDGILRLHTLGWEGQKPASATEIIRSTRDTLGLSSSDLLRRIESLEDIIRNLQIS